MAEQTRGMNRIGTMTPPGSPVDRILTNADRITAQRQAIDAIRDLHTHAPLGTPAGICHHCNTEWPCPTIATLDRHRI